MENLKRLVIVCGGTGGHFYPGLSIGRTFMRKGGKVTLLLSGHHVVSQTEVASGFGIESVVVPSSRRPKSPLGMIRFVWLIFIGILRSWRVLREFRPDALLAMGSFASVPSVLAAKLAGVPVFLHDGNAFVGLANSVLSRFSLLFFAGFPPENASRVHCEWKLVGMPIRPELLENGNISKETAVERLNTEFGVEFTHEKPSVLIFGGSQGAKTFNEVLPTVIAEIEAGAGLQIVHLTGKGKLEETKNAYRDCIAPRLVIESHADMATLFAFADFVICRSGGSTVAELAFFGKKALLAPYPYAADDHQRYNARYYVESGAAEMLSDESQMKEKALLLLREFMAEGERFRLEGVKGREKAFPEASNSIIEGMDRL